MSVLFGPVRTLIDVGASTGGFLFTMLERNPSLFKGLAVEMLPDMAAKLASRVPGNVSVISAACGNIHGTAPCYRSAWHMASSLRQMTPECGSYWDVNLAQYPPVDVEVRRLDDLAREWMPEGEVDILKIDVQGGEREVLEGAPETLHRTRMIYMEVLFVPLYHGAALADELIGMLAKQGFVLVEYHDVYFKRGVRVCADAFLRRA